MTIALWGAGWFFGITPLRRPLPRFVCSNNCCRRLQLCNIDLSVGGVLSD
jgi:hypothetical protein